MTVPTRSDQGHGTSPSWVRRPITLAQLPHVGTVVHAPREASAAPAQFQQSLPTSLPEEIVETEQTVSLRFDRPQAHDVAAPPQESFPERLPQRQQFPSRHKPVGEGPVNSPLYHLYESLAPHAGLIVTLALIACGGFLYWLILRPVEMSPNIYEVPYEQAETQNSEEEATVALLPQLPSESRTQQPAIPGADQTGFPQTSVSTKDDYSKIGNVLNQLPDIGTTESAPTVGARPSFEVESPSILR